MASAKQDAANRRNAQKSSGAKTQSGMNVAKMNALKHGMCARQVVIAGEDPEDYEALLRGLLVELDPQGFIEEQFVERVACCLWRLRRSSAIEAAIFTYQQCDREWDLARDRVRDLELNWPTNDGYAIDVNTEETDEEKEHLKEYEAAQEAKQKAWEELRAPKTVLGESFGKLEQWLDNLFRYETAIERSLFRAVRELERLQAERQARDGGGSIIDVTADGNPPSAAN